MSSQKTNRLVTWLWVPLHWVLFAIEKLSERGPLRVPRILYYAPIVSAVTVISMASMIVLVVGLSSPHTCPPGWPREQVRWAFLWSGSALALGCAVLWCIAVFIASIRNSVRVCEKGDGQALRRIAMVVLLLLAGALAVAYVSGGVFVIDYSTTLKRAILKCAEVNIGGLQLLGSTFVILAAALAVTACSLMTLPIAREQGTPLEDLARLVGGQLRYFKISLYSAATLLIVGVFQVYAAFTWGEASMALRHGADHLGEPEPAALALGIVYTLALLGIFLPAGLALGQYRSDLISEASRAAKRPLDTEKWLAANGLSQSPLQAVGTIAALLSPLLTGVLTLFFKASVGS